MSVKIYVEGGGNGNALRRKCREGFSEFFRKTGLQGRMPKIMACGPRNAAYDDFCTALKQTATNDFIILLVDSEAEITPDDSAWEHLKKRDEWTKPRRAKNDNVHLMVQCMEAWFIADRDALREYFGQYFKPNALPVRNDIENITKSDLEQALEKATTATRKGAYHKSKHSFDILARLNPDKVKTCSPHAERLVKTLHDNV